MSMDFLKILAGIKPLPDDPAQISQLVQYAEHEHVLAYLAVHGDLDHIPKLRERVKDATIRAGYDKARLLYEIDRLERALFGMDMPIILLKGGAYAALGLAAAEGRRVSDLDILVAADDIPRLEKALAFAGWEPDPSTGNAYDQAYYKTYMHELAPYRHTVRKTILDIHHRLTPKTGRLHVDHLTMMRDAETLSDKMPRIKALSAVDRFLHSALHCLYDGELDTPARSFIELYRLYNDLADAEPSTLFDRARATGFERPFILSLLVIGGFFGDDKASRFLAAVPAPLSLRYFNHMLKWVLMGGVRARFAKAFFFVRGHWLRMPIPLLLRHLFKKAVRKKEVSDLQSIMDQQFRG